MRHHRKAAYLLRFWRRRQRADQAALAAAREHDRAEQLAARRRVLNAATVGLPVVAPSRAPLLTPGQLARVARR